MRAVPAIRDALGFICLVLAMLLASPGVRVTKAESDFSYDPALDPGAVTTVAQPAPASPEPHGGASCGAKQTAGAPTFNQLLMAEVGEGELNSLNGRGYNIGPKDPRMQIRLLEFESRRAR